VLVSDTGVGIPKNKISRLGERFYRVDPARSRELGGTGLGLAIVKHLVLSMEGKFQITSKPGKGTQASFTLPRK
ncbi:MAG: sensor histidine kinase, partial [Nitrospinota bacterium]